MEFLLRYSIFVIFILSSAHTADPLEAVSCSSSLKQCTHSLKKYGLNGTVLFPPISAPDINMLCREVEVVEACLNRIPSDCQVLLSTYLTGFKESFAYICGEDFIDFYLSIPCLSRNYVMQEARDCHTRYTARLDQIQENNHVIQAQVAAQQTCSAVENFVNCVTSLLERECGPAAARWHYNVYEKSLEPLLTAMSGEECVLHWPQVSQFPGIIAVWVAFSVMVMVTITLIIYFLPCHITWYTIYHDSQPVTIETIPPPLDKKMLQIA